MMAHSNEIEHDDILNNYILSFQMQKITHDGVEGFFIPFTGYKQLLFLLNDYVFLQKKYDITMKHLKNYNAIKFGLGTMSAVSITEFILLFVVGFFCYSMGVVYGNK
jgi:hypothetical protein